MNTSGEEIKELKRLLETHQDRYMVSLFDEDPDLYWDTRKALGLHMCRLKQCNGGGIIGNGFGDQYYCGCMTDTERFADKENRE